eukprot:13298963-Alexandrium_andersonii.AAC.1
MVLYAPPLFIGQISYEGVEMAGIAVILRRHHCRVTREFTQVHRPMAVAGIHHREAMLPKSMDRDI